LPKQGFERSGKECGEMAVLDELQARAVEGGGKLTRVKRRPDPL